MDLRNKGSKKRHMRTNGNPKHKTNAKQEPLQTLETTQCRPECKG